MANRNKRGPLEDGPMTGKRMGLCVENSTIGNSPGFKNSRYGLGRRGRGMGFRHRVQYTSNISEEVLLNDEIKILKDQLESVERELSQIKNSEK